MPPTPRPIINHFSAMSRENRAEVPGSEMSVGCALEEQRAELGPWGAGDPYPPWGTDFPRISEHLSFHSLWAHEEQWPHLLTPGIPIPSTRSWEPPESPQGQRTEPPGGEAGTVRRTACQPPALQPTPGRPASKQRVLLIRVPFSWGLAEGGRDGLPNRPHSQEKASAGDLPRGPVCPQMACEEVLDEGQEGPFTTSRAGVSHLF